MGKSNEDILAERCRQLIEVAKHWRRRSQMLERRLEKLQPADSEMEGLSDVLEAELARLGQTTIEQALTAGGEQILG